VPEAPLFIAILPEVISKVIVPFVEELSASELLRFNGPLLPLPSCNTYVPSIAPELEV